MSTMKYLNMFFLKKIQFLRILYSLYNNLAIFIVKKFLRVKIGKIRLQKMQIGESFYWRKKHGKIAHVINFAHKIFLSMHSHNPSSLIHLNHKIPLIIKIHNKYKYKNFIHTKKHLSCNIIQLTAKQDCSSHP